jgi:DUF4097 and DUF4098 domain-containing protein YvlB
MKRRKNKIIIALTSVATSAIRLSALALIVVWCGGAVAVRAQESGMHETYNLTPGGILSVNNTNGYIRVTTWDENRVRVDAVKQGGRGEDLSLVQIDVNAQPGAIYIKTIYPGDMNSDRRGRGNAVLVNYDLKVPRSALLNSLTSLNGEITVTGPAAQVTARSTNGDVSARDITGVATLTTINGRLTAARIGGALIANSTNGEISVDTAETTVNARAINGNVRAANIRGDSVFNTSSGNIRIERTAGRVISRALNGNVTVIDASGDVTADSPSSVVTVENARGRVTASTLSGQIIIRGASEGVRATLISGEIALSNIRGRIEIRSTSANIQLRNLDSREVQVNNSSGNIYFEGKLYQDGRYAFESFSGEITVLIPADTGFNLTARTTSGSINTEFPIQLAPGSSLGGVRNLRGTVGNGGPDIITVGFSGSIFLKKAPRTTER